MPKRGLDASAGPTARRAHGREAAPTYEGPGREDVGPARAEEERDRVAIRFW